MAGSAAWAAEAAGSAPRLLRATAAHTRVSTSLLQLRQQVPQRWRGYSGHPDKLCSRVLLPSAPWGTQQQQQQQQQRRAVATDAAAAAKKVRQDRGTGRRIGALYYRDGYPGVVWEWTGFFFNAMCRDCWPERAVKAFHP